MEPPVSLLEELACEIELQNGPCDPPGRLTEGDQQRVPRAGLDLEDREDALLEWIETVGRPGAK